MHYFCLMFLLQRNSALAMRLFCDFHRLRAHLLCCPPQDRKNDALMQTHANVMAFYARWDQRMMAQNKKWSQVNPGTIAELWYFLLH
jgi:hypothetical protein